MHFNMIEVLQLDVFLWKVPIKEEIVETLQKMYELVCGGRP